MNQLRDFVLKKTGNAFCALALNGYDSIVCILLLVGQMHDGDVGALAGEQDGDGAPYSRTTNR